VELDCSVVDTDDFPGASLDVTSVDPLVTALVLVVSEDRSDAEVGKCVVVVVKYPVEVVARVDVADDGCCVVASVVV
jgi:hypothetical protein